jgi:hypothetical protein
MKITLSLILTKGKNLYLIIALIISAALLLTFNNFNIELYFFLNNFLYFFIFFALGFLLKKLKNIPVNRILAVFTFLIVLIVSIFLVKNYYYIVANIRNPLQYITDISITLVCLGMIFFFSNIFKENRLINYISNNTLTIMCIHIPFNSFACGVLKHIFFINTTQIPTLFALIAALFSLISTILVAIVLNKYAPLLIGKKQTKD